MNVIDASVAFDALERSGTSRERLTEVEAHAPHLIDAEVVHALRRKVLRGHTDSELARRQLEIWGRASVQRHDARPLLARTWDLRENLTAYDAQYVALAESLRCPLVTRDAGLAGAPGLRCEVQLLVD